LLGIFGSTDGMQEFIHQLEETALLKLTSNFCLWRSERHVTSQDRTQLPLVRKKPHEDLIFFSTRFSVRNVHFMALKVADLHLSPNITPFLFLTWGGHVIVTATIERRNDKIQSCLKIDKNERIQCLNASYVNTLSIPSTSEGIYSQRLCYVGCIALILEVGLHVSIYTFEKLET
jgi:hypothetical protein